MKTHEVQRSIEESMRSGAARILDDSAMLHSDPRKHAERLTAVAVHAARTDDDRSWAIVVNGMSRLVYRISETYFWKWRSHLSAQASFDDVFMAGMEGLMIGVRKFDPDRGFMLSSYVTNWIRTKVQRACYAQCGAAKIPEEILQRGLKPGAPLVSSSTMSLDYRPDTDSPTLGDTLVASEEEGIHEIEGLGRLLELLRGVDERLPAVAQYVERGYADREISRIVGVTIHEVGELRLLARATIIDAGLA